ncbi:MAG: hypothetical protein KBT29_09535 [Prevotellaceae bacterium]|nr:hypothetical protein [Candidatus Minthosoma caballi]
MKKKNYEKPQIQVIEVDQTEIICASPEQLGEGDPIFGSSSAKDRLFFDEEY